MNVASYAKTIFKQLLVLGITIVVLILFGSYMLWRNNQPTPSENADAISPTSTNVRHDNSGAGVTQENPLQEHFDRAMQHLGL